MPCPNCNRADGHEIPRLPFTPEQGQRSLILWTI
jgi:hypothetical protein